MKEISARIVIRAPASKVWSVLTDFSEYPGWNPFIESVDGDVSAGKNIRVSMKPPGARRMTFKPKVLVFSKNKKLQWLGHLLFPGLFDGRHTFSITDNGNGTVTFVQSESFSGILVPLFSKMINENTKNGFVMMNKKLKNICEKHGKSRS